MEKVKKNIKNINYVINYVFNNVEVKTEFKEDYYLTTIKQNNIFISVSGLNYIKEMLESITGTAKETSIYVLNMNKNNIKLKIRGLNNE